MVTKQDRGMAHFYISTKKLIRDVLPESIIQPDHIDVFLLDKEKSLVHSYIDSISKKEEV
jgi:hypothetical protein